MDGQDVGWYQGFCYQTLLPVLLLGLFVGAFITTVPLLFGLLLLFFIIYFIHYQSYLSHMPWQL